MINSRFPPPCVRRFLTACCETALLLLGGCWRARSAATVCDPKAAALSPSGARPQIDMTAASPEPAQGGVASISSCVYNLTNTIIGSGVLALPAAFATCGSALGSGLLLVFALFSAHGLHLLSLAAQIVDGNTASFRAVASAAAPRFATFVDLAVIIKCFGVACSYLIVVGDSLPIVAQRALPDVAFAARRRTRRRGTTLCRRRRSEPRARAGAGRGR